jgi:hypothetical protein
MVFYSARVCPVDQQSYDFQVLINRDEIRLILY